MDHDNIHLGVKTSSRLAEFTFKDTLIGPVNVVLDTITVLPVDRLVAVTRVDVVLVVHHQLPILLHGHLVMNLE